MRVDIIVPNFDKSSDSITLSSWYKKPGEKVLKGEIIADAETDTISCGITASFDCILAKIVVPNGYEIDAGTKIAVVEKDLEADTSKMQEESDIAIEEYKKTHRKPQEKVINEPPAAQIVAKIDVKKEELNKEHKKKDLKNEVKKDGVKGVENKKEQSIDESKKTLYQSSIKPESCAAKLSEDMKNSVASSNNIGINTYKPSDLNKKSDLNQKSEGFKKVDSKSDINPLEKTVKPSESLEKMFNVDKNKKIEKKVEPKSETYQMDFKIEKTFGQAEKTTDNIKNENLEHFEDKSIKPPEKTLAMLEVEQSIALKGGPVEREETSDEKMEEIKLDPSLYEEDLPKSLFLRHSKEEYNEDEIEEDEVNVKKSGIQKATGFISKLFHAIQESFFDGDSNISFQRETPRVKNGIEDPKDFIDNSINEVANDDASINTSSVNEEEDPADLRIQRVAEEADKILETKNSRVDDILDSVAKDISETPENSLKIENEKKTETASKNEEIKKNESSLKSTLLSKLGINKDNKSKSILSKFGIKNAKEEVQTSLLSDLGLKPEDGLKSEAPSYRIVGDDVVIEKVVAEKLRDEIIVKDSEIIKSASDELVVEKIDDKQKLNTKSSSDFKMPKLRPVRHLKDESSEISSVNLDSKNLEKVESLKQNVDLKDDVSQDTKSVFIKEKANANKNSGNKKVLNEKLVFDDKGRYKGLQEEIKIELSGIQKQTREFKEKIEKQDDISSIETKEKTQQKPTEKIIESSKKPQAENVIDKVLSKAVQNTNQFLAAPITKDIVSWKPQGGELTEIKIEDERVGVNMVNEFDNGKASKEDVCSSDTAAKVANILKDAEENANEEAKRLKEDILTHAHEEALAQAQELKNKIFQEYEELAMKEANDMRNKIVQGSISEAENTKQGLISEAVSKAYEEANSIRQQIFHQASSEAKSQSLASLNDTLTKARELAKDRANKLSKEIIQKALNESKFEAKEIKKDVIHSATKYAAKESENIIKDTVRKAKLDAQFQAEKIIDSAIQLTSNEAEMIVHETMYKAKEKSEAKWQEIVEKMSYKAVKEAEKLVEDTLLKAKTCTEKMTQDIIESVKRTALQESQILLKETIEKAKEESKTIGRDIVDSISRLATKEAETLIKEAIHNAKARSEESGNKIISDVSEQATKEAEQIIKFAMERARKSAEYKTNEIVNSIANVATYKAEEIADQMIKKVKENSERKGDEVVNIAKNRARSEVDRIMLENINKVKSETQQNANDIVLSVKKHAEEEAKAIVLEAMAKARSESQEKGKQIVESIEGAAYQEAQNIVSESVARVKMQTELTGKRILSSVEELTRDEAEKVVIESLQNAKKYSLSMGDEIVGLIKEETRKGAEKVVMESLDKIKENSKLTSENATVLIEDRMMKEADELIQNSLKSIKNKAYEVEGAADSLQRHATKTIGGILEDTLLKIRIQADDLEESFCESTQSAINSIADLASHEAKNILKDALGKAQNHYDKRAKEIIDALSINKHMIKNKKETNACDAKVSQNETSEIEALEKEEGTKIVKDEPLDVLLSSLTKRLHDQAQDLLDDYKNHSANSAYKEGVLTKDKLDEYTDRIRAEAQKGLKSVERTEKLSGCPTTNGYCIPGDNENCNNCTLNKFKACVSSKETDLIQKLMNTDESEGSPDMYADNWNKPQGFDTPTDEKIKIDEFRQKIYEHRKNFIDHSVIATMSEEVDMSAVLALSKSFGEQFSEKYNTRLGFTPFFISGALSALKKYKMFNAHINEDTIIYKNTYDISIITCGNDGLLAPVLRHADSMSIADIEKAMITLSRRAINGELTLEEVSGGTFTVINAGVYGSTLGSDLLTPPQVATLSVHKMHERPVATKNGIEVRPILYISLSYDQRVADKKLASEFLNTVKGYVENPGWNSLGL